MEELLAYLFLRLVGIVTEEEYQNKLDEAFLADGENEILLELELNDDIWHAVALIEERINWDSLGCEAVGKALVSLLEHRYFKCSDKKEFGKKTYALWGMLPGVMSGEDPFRMLSYADEPLSWGDEEQSGSLYQEMFDFYKAKD
ncbi:MAG: hypothetical protein K2K53_14020 [Oscillospiraceae bacterium]|nr:hypothetical protein [Oscillospiraceae bacterium]